MAAILKYDRLTVAPQVGEAGGFQAPSTDGFGIAGQQLQALGQAIEGAGHAAAAIHADALDRANRVQVMGANGRAQQLANELTAGKDGFTRLHGDVSKLPSGKPLGVEYSERLDKGLAEIAAGLANDRQRELFAEGVAPLRAQFGESALRYEAAATQDYSLTKIDGLVAAATQAITIDPSNFDSIDTQLGAITKAYFDKAGLLGWDDNTRTSQTMAVTSAAISQAINQLLADGNGAAAEALLKQYRTRLSADTASNLTLRTKALKEDVFLTDFGTGLRERMKAPPPRVAPEGAVGGNAASHEGSGQTETGNRAPVAKHIDDVPGVGPAHGPEARQWTLEDSLRYADSAAPADASPGLRRALRNEAERVYQQHQGELHTAQERAYTELEVKARKGDLTDTQIETSYRTGAIGSGHRATLAAQNEAARRQRTAQVQDLDAYNRLAADPHFHWNPFDARQQQLVEAAAKAGGGTTAIRTVWRQTHIVPKSGAAALRSALVSTDPKRVQEAAILSAQMLLERPNAFAGIDGHEEIERPAWMFNHYVHDLGLDPREAAKRIADGNTPEGHAKALLRKPERDLLLRALQQQNIYSVEKRLGGKFANSDQTLEAATTLAELTVDNWMLYGDRSKATALALQQMGKMYAVMPNGKLQKWAPTLRYEPIGGSYDYLYWDAVETIHEERAKQKLPPIKLLPHSVGLVPVRGVTDVDIQNADQPPRYRIVYQYKRGKEVITETVPGWWAADIPKWQAAAQRKADADARVKRAQEVNRQRFERAVRDAGLSAQATIF